MQGGGLSKMLAHGAEKEVESLVLASICRMICPATCAQQGRKMASFGAAAEPDDGHDSKELLAVEWVMNIK